MADEAVEIALVEQAIASRLGGCLDWVDERAERKIRSDAELRGLTPNAIKEILVDWVDRKSCAITRRRENRPEFTHRREFWFRVLGAVPGFPRDLFVELELTDDDDDCPVVTILNAHLNSN